MSEADNVWRVKGTDREHEIEVDHNTMTGKIIVKLDGEEVGEERMIAKKKQVEFTVGDQPAIVEVSFAYGGFGATSELHIGGHYVEPLKR